MPKQTQKPGIPDYTKVIYKGITFEIRKNFIGVGRAINDLITKHDDSMTVEPLWLMRLPEFKEYSLCIHNCRVIRQDIEKQEEKLKATRDTKLQKKLRDIIAKETADFQKESGVLDNPAVAAVAARYTAIEHQVRFEFINDPDNIRAAAEALLVGDLSQIDFNTFDEGFVSFRDMLFDVFFSMKSRMLQRSMNT